MKPDQQQTDMESEPDITIIVLIIVLMQIIIINMIVLDHMITVETVAVLTTLKELQITLNMIYLLAEQLEIDPIVHLPMIDQHTVLNPIAQLKQLVMAVDLIVLPRDPEVIVLPNMTLALPNMTLTTTPKLVATLHQVILLLNMIPAGHHIRQQITTELLE